MQALRQLGVGVIIAIASVILVLGGIFLSLAETLPPAATPTPIPPTFPQNFPTPTATQTSSLPTETVTNTASPSPTTLVLQPTSCTPPSGWIRITTTTNDTIYSLAQRYKSTAENLSAVNCLSTFDLPAGSLLYVPPVPTVTVVPCGPPAGWVRAYVVRPGDTLYRVALSYGLTYPQLQRANCMGNSTTIYTGQRLWVPNIPTRTPVPGVTNLPDFPTDTSVPSTNTVPPSNTPPPTNTNPPPATATQTSIPASTNTPNTPSPLQ